MKFTLKRMGIDTHKESVAFLDDDFYRGPTRAVGCIRSVEYSEFHLLQSVDAIFCCELRSDAYG